MDSREIPQAGARPSCRRDNDLDAPGEPSTYRRSHYDAGDLVPGNHSGLASLPGADQATVGYVDPPVFTASASPPAEGGTLYDYAISDQFQPTGGESTASVVEVAVPAGATVNLKWEAVCHAADYRIYREVVGTGQWYLQGTYSPPSTNPSTPTVPNDTSADPVSTTDVSGGGKRQLTYTDAPTITGTAQTVGWEPPTANLAAELPREQNQYLTQALKDVGVTGADDHRQQGRADRPHRPSG